jgi:hypothetical protein
MILLPLALRPCAFPCLLRVTALAVTTAFLTIGTGALAQERYRTPDEAVAALVEAVRSDALQKKDIPSKASGGLPIRAITIRFSPGKGGTPRAAKPTIW